MLVLHNLKLLAKNLWGNYWVHIVSTGIAILVLFGAVQVGYMRGYSKASVACATDQLEASKKGTSDHAKIEHKNMQLGDPALDKSLSKWMRD